MKATIPYQAAKKRLLLSLVSGVLYTLGFFVAFRMMWVDLSDRYLALESIIAHTGQALLYTIYAPITFTRLRGSAWALLFLFVLGFITAWLILLIREHRKNRNSRAS